jgi:hypothetical protein
MRLEDGRAVIHDARNIRIRKGNAAVRIVA